MKKSGYLGELKGLLDRTRPALAKKRRLEFKNCFGAVAGYVDGAIFISCGSFGVALRLPPGVLAQLFQHAGASPLKYFPNGHVKKDYAVIPERIIHDSSRFPNLLDEAVRYASSARRTLKISAPAQKLR